MSQDIVVVGIDGSEGSLSALREAASYARLMGADLRCVVSWVHLPYGDAEEFYDPKETAAEIGRDSLRQVFGPAIPPGVTVVTKLGPAGPSLVAESEHAALLVVGTRGHSALGGLLVGSVSTYCAEHASCPVLTVPTAHGHGRTLVDAAPAGAAGS